jgi:uncharacterized membrane protein YraQ (UPF0718 family)
MPAKGSTIATAIMINKSSRAQVVFQTLVLGFILLLLIGYKGTAGLNKIRQGGVSGSLSFSNLQFDAGVGRNATTFSNTLAYLKIIWPALLFGLLISAAARTSLSRTRLRSIFRGTAVREQIVAALSGAPLMLCSCCVAPIFPTIYQRTRKLAPALATTLASPSLNPAALILSFALFPLRIAGARLIMALLLVLFGSVAVAKVSDTQVPMFEAESEQEESTWRGLLSSYGISLLHVAWRTIPLILLGIWASISIMRHLPLHLGGKPGSDVLAVAVIALFSALITLPSLFEIPLALSILAAGGPIGGAIAVLFAGPATNMSALLVIGRYSNWKVAVLTAATIWGLAVAGGLALG